MATSFTSVYNRFLGKITDDLYVELTPEDTIRDLQNLLINAIPDFEFPRVNLLDYTILTSEVSESEVSDSDFVIGKIWVEDENDDIEDYVPKVLIEKSYFAADLTEEELNILALLMMANWLQRQVTSIENIRMKYSGTDFKFTSQANHLSKLISLQDQVKKQSMHLQRLYKRRKIVSDGRFESNWSVLREKSTFDYWGKYYDRY